MGIAERKAKEKEKLKALILEGAKKLFIEKGIDKTTIRNIADAIEYSVGTVYVYYKDKNAILHDLHTQGFQQLGGAMRVLNSVTDPMERLKALGRVYINFAEQNPDMYDLMFSMKAPIEFLESQHRDDWNEGAATFNVMQNTVKQCIERGHFMGHKLEPLSFMIWGCVHGMCALNNSGRVNGVKFEKVDGMVAKGYEEVLKLIDKN
ncbi:MAG: TetR/AcrR family transcriptional regulator [Cyclobacteriaceae bacterium]